MLIISSESQTPRCEDAIPSVWKKIQVPNRTKKVNEYVISYDKTNKMNDDIDVDSLCILLPAINPAKALLKRAVERANIVDYMFDGNKHRKKKQKN